MKAGALNREAQIFYVGAMLAHFSLLGASWAHFLRLAAFVAFLGRFFRALGRSRVDFGRPRTSPESVLEPPGPYFASFLPACAHALSEWSECSKTTIFIKFLYGFYTSRAWCSRHKTMQNRSQSLSDTTSCKDCAQNASWAAFSEDLVLPGPSIGQLLVALGRLLASLGCLSGVPWALLGRSWLSLGCSGELQGCILIPRSVPGPDFRGFGDVPD